ncbi:PP2C family protein-serine/threonine phosphatase [Caballeronia sp. DA-9]|uniref:PP2C family protein-serine/threonine phosphatase n=1 Tax=Caballeronia sp. DA-9 TaxID=3436237 RepID=UPI003F671508
MNLVKLVESWRASPEQNNLLPRLADTLKMLKETLIHWFSRSTLDRATNVNALLPFALATDVGATREENQDRIAAIRVFPTSQLIDPFITIAVADGMGGMRDGAACASNALAVFFSNMASSEVADPVERIELAAREANTAVFDLYGGHGGATLSAVCIGLTGNSVLANVGDSRIYSTSGDDKPTVQRLTVDDSLAEAVGGHGRELLQFVGMGEGLKTHISTINQDTERVLITSDGVHYVNHEALCEIFRNAPDIYRTVERLLALSRWCGSPDNASLAAIDLKRLRDEFGSSADAGITVWDPFSSTEFFTLKATERRAQPDLLSKVGAAPTATITDAADKHTQPEPLPKKPRKRGPKSKADKKAKDNNGPQLVIQIDSEQESTASEKSGEDSE